MLYSPWVLVTAVAVSFVSTFVTVTVAPGSARWLASPTRPFTVARTSCAEALTVMASSITSSSPQQNQLFLIGSLLPRQTGLAEPAWDLGSAHGRAGRLLQARRATRSLPGTTAAPYTTTQYLWQVLPCIAKRGRTAVF